ncbi:MAG TPA: hypothetical protein VKE74_11050 [Gemmataceae bacterium]|nr:hypothetical protein [Gemmataceae bacterium]
MFDPSVVAPIIASAVGLVGALVAGLSVYLNYRGRHNQFRQVVYGRQMDAYFDITGAMANLYTAAQTVLACGNPRLKGDDARRQFRAALREEHERFTGTVNRALIVLPSRVRAAVDNFNEMLLAISAPAEERVAGRHAAEDHPEPGQDLARAYERAINSIRHHLAIDSLTAGMLREMGIGSESVTLKGGRHGVSPLVSVGRKAPSAAFAQANTPRRSGA